MKGHIRERSPGHWAIVIDGRDADGTRNGNGSRSSAPSARRKLSAHA